MGAALREAAVCHALPCPQPCAFWLHDVSCSTFVQAQGTNVHNSCSGEHFTVSAPQSISVWCERQQHESSGRSKCRHVNKECSQNVGSEGNVAPLAILSITPLLAVPFRTAAQCGHQWSSVHKAPLFRRRNAGVESVGGERVVAGALGADKAAPRPRRQAGLFGLGRRPRAVAALDAGSTSCSGALQVARPRGWGRGQWRSGQTRAEVRCGASLRRTLQYVQPSGPRPAGRQRCGGHLFGAEQAEHAWMGCQREGIAAACSDMLATSPRGTGPRASCSNPGRQGQTSTLPGRRWHRSARG